MKKLVLGAVAAATVAVPLARRPRHRRRHRRRQHPADHRDLHQRHGRLRGRRHATSTSAARSGARARPSQGAIVGQCVAVPRRRRPTRSRVARGASTGRLRRPVALLRRSPSSARGYDAGRAKATVTVTPVIGSPTKTVTKWVTIVPRVVRTTKGPLPTGSGPLRRAVSSAGGSPRCTAAPWSRRTCPPGCRWHGRARHRSGSGCRRSAATGRRRRAVLVNVGQVKTTSVAGVFGSNFDEPLLDRDVRAEGVAAEERLHDLRARRAEGGVPGDVLGERRRHHGEVLVGHPLRAVHHAEALVRPEPGVDQLALLLVPDRGDRPDGVALELLVPRRDRRRPSSRCRAGRRASRSGRGCSCSSARSPGRRRSRARAGTPTSARPPSTPPATSSGR